MRPIKKSHFTPASYIYKPYNLAKDDLIISIGNYCSYCERQAYSSALDVEHIRDKQNNPERKFLWRNFILSCKNCNSIKSTKNVANMYFPTVHNTFEIFDYDIQGSVNVNRALLTTNDEIARAENLISLIGLDRRPGHPSYSQKDKRWSERKDVYALAIRYLPNYRNGTVNDDVIIDLAVAKGFWSVWMIVFSGEVAIVNRLKSEFAGTNL